MSDTNFSSGVFEVMSRSNPDYQPVALDVTRDETEHYQQAILRVADMNQTDTILTVCLSVRDLTVLADALEKMQKTAQITSPNLLRLVVRFAFKAEDGDYFPWISPKEKLEVSYVANAARFRLARVVPKSSEKSDDPKDWTEQSAEAWLTAGETTAFIASARLFASVLENNQLS